MMDIHCRVISFLLPILLLLTLCPEGIAKTIYVDDDAIGLNDGTSWADAYTFLQEALADARLAEKPVEIRVARGIYTPDRGGGNTPGEREATFKLLDGVALKGGFAGFSEPDSNARDIDLYEAILSGDLAGNDIEGVSPTALLDEPTRAENSFHVVTSREDNPTAVLDGFTITGGNADGSWEHCSAAGLDNGNFDGKGSSITVLNCTFTRNSTTGSGGGMVNTSHPTLVNCTFRDNAATRGGGMSNSGNPILVNCTFIGNCASGHGHGEGGGISTHAFGNPKLINCTFFRNWAHRSGGAVHNGPCTVALTNCTFTENSVSASSSKSGGAIYNDDGSKAILTNCILWNNRPLEISWDEGDLPVAMYSNIQVLWLGEGNIYTDPLFADPNNDDFHLKSKAGRWDPIRESWVVDDVTSPCIDAGDPNSPIAFEPFPNGGMVNMGTYGGMAEASKSPSGLHAKYGGGTGEPNNPYQIYTPEQMNTIGIHAGDWDKHFELMEDIDLAAYTGTDFNIIGYRPDMENKSFTGVFDGNGHTISNFTYISTNVHRVGLFDYVEGKLAEIRDLGLIDPVIDAGMIDPDVNQAKGNNAASLVSYLWEGTVSHCYVRGGSVSGDLSVGGLIAYNHKGVVVDCCSTTDITGGREVGGLVGYNGGTIIGCYAFSNITGEIEVGGLAGYCYFDSTIRESSASGNVTGSRSVGGLVGSSSRNSTIQGSFSTGRIIGIREVGGLVGFSHGDLTNCYSSCSVSGGRNVGGLVGLLGGVVTDCYSVGNIVHEPIEGFKGNSRISGLVGTGYDPNDIHGSFWDVETSGQTVSFGGTGLTTAEMQTAGTFLEAGWDFIDEIDNGNDDIWWITEGRDYPRLWWEMIPEN